MRFLFYIFIVLISCLPVAADIPAAYVDIGFGARPMGMGGAYTALSNDINAMFWNPAGMTFIQGSQVTAMYTKQFGLIPYGFAAYGGQFYGNYAGLGFITSGNDVLRETTFLGSYAIKFFIPYIGTTRLGANVRYRRSSFGNNQDGGEFRSQGDASGFGVDAGVLWVLNPKTSFGIFGRDLFNAMYYNNTTRDVSYSESIPRTLVFGLARSIRQGAFLTLDWEQALYSDTFNKIHVGTEIQVFQLIVLRGGFWQNVEGDINRNYSAGMGLNYTARRVAVQFDFAYLFNDLANTPRVSLTVFYK